MSDDDRRRVRRAARSVGLYVGIASAVIITAGVGILIAVVLSTSRREGEEHEGGWPGRGVGDDFVVDETVWHGHVADGRQFLCEGRSGKVSFRLLHIFELRDGKISREHVWCDLAAIQRQLGCELH